MLAIARLFLSFTILSATASLACGEPQSVRLAIVAIDPGQSGQLGEGEPLYVRVSYRSDRPLSLMAEGLSNGRTVSGFMVGPAPQHRAGEGEAVVWVSYRAGHAIDEVKISAIDGRSRRIADVRAAARFEWTAGPSLHAGARTDWALHKSPEPQWSPDRQAWEGGLWLGMAIMLLVPAYVVVQIWFAWAWVGGWRIAALVPLIAMVPAFLYSMAALSHGSNLWPIAVILLAPVGFIYLVVVGAARVFARAVTT
jgi:hypothetical protein